MIDLLLFAGILVCVAVMAAAFTWHYAHRDD